jgi:histone deacetylase 6
MWSCLFGLLYISCQNVPSVISVELTSHICMSYQVEIKPNPHPERPDRLRAIAASLAAAGAH